MQYIIVTNNTNNICSIKGVYYWKSRQISDTVWLSILHYYDHLVESLGTDKGKQVGTGEIIPLHSTGPVCENTVFSVLVIIWLLSVPVGEVHLGAVRPHPPALLVSVTQSDPGGTLSRVVALDQVVYNVVFIQVVDRGQGCFLRHSVWLCIGPINTQVNVLEAMAIRAIPAHGAGALEKLSILARQNTYSKAQETEETVEHWHGEKVLGSAALLLCTGLVGWEVHCARLLFH